MVAIDVSSVILSAAAYAVEHPIAAASFAANLVTGISVLVKRTLALDLVVLTHRIERRRLLGRLARDRHRVSRRLLRKSAARRKSA